MFEFANGLVIFYHHLLEEFVVGWRCKMCNGVNSLVDSNCLDCDGVRPVEATSITLVAGTFELEQTGSVCVN